MSGCHHARILGSDGTGLDEDAAPHGSYGTRSSDEFAVRPKPMVECGDRPVIRRSMSSSASYGIGEVIVCAARRATCSRNASSRNCESDLSVDLGCGEVAVHLALRAVEVAAADDHGFFVPGAAPTGPSVGRARCALYGVNGSIAPELERGIDRANLRVGIDWPRTRARVSDTNQRQTTLHEAELPRTEDR